MDEATATTVSRWMPHAANALSEVVRRRRATNSPASAVFRAGGSGAGSRRIRDAANLWAGLTRERGVAGRDAVWAHPDLMPSADDLDDLRLLARTRTRPPATRWTWSWRSCWSRPSGNAATSQGTPTTSSPGVDERARSNRPGSRLHARLRIVLDQGPELRAMPGIFEVGQLVGEHVADHPVGHLP